VIVCSRTKFWDVDSGEGYLTADDGIAGTERLVTGNVEFDGLLVGALDGPLAVSDSPAVAVCMVQSQWCWTF
jgi:hypothetical protein